MSIKSKLDYRYIYVLGNWAYPFRYKIGIAKSVEKRKAGIDRSQRGKIYDLFWIKVLFAHQIEGFLHWLYAPLNARMSGSGHTEWFWMIFPFTPILLLIIVWALQILIIPAAVVGGFYYLYNMMGG
jgi:T5orf172 domain